MPVIPFSSASRAAGAADDITEQVEAEEARRYREAAAAKLKDLMNTPVKRFDPNGGTSPINIPEPVTGGWRVRTNGDPQPNADALPGGVFNRLVEPDLDDPVRDETGFGQVGEWTEDLARPAAPEGDSGSAGMGSGGPGGEGGLSDQTISDIRDRLRIRKEGDSTRELRARMLNAPNADQAAIDADLAERQGVNRLEVERNRDTFVAVDRAQAIDELRKTAPKLRAWLDYNPANLEVAHDDVESLGWWEQTQAFFSPGNLSLEKTGQALQSGFVDKIPEQLYGLDQMLGDANASIYKALPDWFPGKFGLVNEQVQRSLMADMKRQEMAAQGKANAPVGETWLERGIYGAAQSAPSTLVSLAITAVTKSPVVGSGSMGATTAGGAYGEARDEGKSLGDAFRYALTQGGIETATEFIPLKFLVDDLAKDSSFAKTFFRQAAAEGITEQAATFLQDASTFIELNPDKTLGEFLAERPNAALETLVASTIMSGVTTTVAQGMQAAGDQIDRNARQKRAEARANYLTDMKNNANSSKLLKRGTVGADKYREVAAQALAGGPRENLLIDPEAIRSLAQEKGVTVEQLATAWRIEAETITTAMDTGDFVAVPTGNYAAALVTAKKDIGVSGDVIDQALSADMKFSLDDSTARESEAAKAAFEEAMQARAEVGEREQAFADAEDRLRNTIRQQIADLGVYNAETSETYAEERAAKVVTLAQRMSAASGQEVDPEQLYKDEFAPIVLGGTWTEDSGAIAQSMVRTANPPGDVELEFASKELSPQEFEAWKGARDGLSNEAIAERMNAVEPDAVVSADDVKRWLFRSRERGYDSQKPHFNDRGMSPVTQRLIELRARGVKNPQIAAALYPDVDTETALNRVKALASKNKAKIEERKAALASPGNRGEFQAQTATIKRKTTLFESQRLDTLLHEGAHEYLDIVWRMSRREDANPYIIGHWAAILNWHGLHPEWSNMYDPETGFITAEGRKLHETFAEAYGVYFMTGQAPTTALRSVFETIKQWMLSVYKAMKLGMSAAIRDVGPETRAKIDAAERAAGKRLKTQEIIDLIVPAEIRQVFDRSLASDEAINAVHAGFVADGETMAKSIIAKLDPKGLWKPERKEKFMVRMRERYAAARDLAKARHSALLIEQHTRRLTNVYQEEEREVRREVQSEIDERPEQRAFYWLSTGQYRDTREAQAEEAAAQAEAMLSLAQADGYLGADLKEAAEWIAARAKGLDMSDAARNARAKEMGFTAKGFHETTEDSAVGIISGFELNRRRAATGDHIMPVGVFTKPTAGKIGIGKVQVPLLMRLGNNRTFTDRAELEAHLRQDAAYASIVDEMNAADARYKENFNARDAEWRNTERRSPEWRQRSDELNAILSTWEAEINRLGEQARSRATDVLQAEGLNSITVTKDEGSFSRAIKTTVVFNPNDLRSPNAAFDPDKSDSARLLAQGDGDWMGAFLDNYVENPSDRSIQRMVRKMFSQGTPPAVRLLRYDGKTIAFDGFNYTHDDAIQLLGAPENAERALIESGDTLETVRWYDAGGSTLAQTVQPTRQLDASAATYWDEPMVLGADDRIFRPGQPDALGFITSAERALANPPKRFKNAKALSADQWRKLMRDGGASKEAFTYQIEPALRALEQEGVTGDIPKSMFEEALARNRTTFTSIEETLATKPKGGLEPINASDAANYSQYVAPGSWTNYTQQQFIMPGLDYRSHNWDASGVVGHIRTTERKVGGETVLHVEELQSDLHQEGARFGYKGERVDAKTLLERAGEDKQRAMLRWIAWQKDNPGKFEFKAGERNPDGSVKRQGGFWTDDAVGAELMREAEAAVQREYDALNAAQQERDTPQPPRAPVENWEEPFVRHILQRAAKDGYKTVTFPTHDSLHEVLRNEGTDKFYDERLPNTLSRVAKSLGVTVGKETLDLGLRVKREKDTDGSTIYSLVNKEGLFVEWVDGADHGKAVIAERSSVPAIQLTPQAITKLAEGVALYQTGDGAGRTTPPPNLPPMRLNLQAVRDQYGEQALAEIPPEVAAFSATANDVDMYLATARDIRKTLNETPPKSLWKYLSTPRNIGQGEGRISYRGIRDTDGEILKIIGEKKAARGLIADPTKDSKRSRSYDMQQAIEAAWEAGYFDGEELPTPAQFLDTLRADIDGQAPRYRRDDIPTVSVIANAERWEAWFDQNDINIHEKDVSVLRAKLAVMLTGQGENAIGPDEAAPFFKMPNGRALLDGLKQGPLRDKLIREETRKRMIERNGDVFRDGTIMAKAEEYARNELQHRQWEIELEALAEAGGQRIATNALKQQAIENLRSKQVREVLNYNQYLTLERRWSEKAIKEKDPAKAAEYAKYRLLNSLQYTEAKKMAEQIEKAVKHAKSFDSKDKRIKLLKAGKDYIQQIDQILEGYEFKSVTRKKERQSLAAWFASKQAAIDPLRDLSGLSEEELMAAQQEEIDRSEAPAVMQADAAVRNYKSLTVEELMAVRDQLDMIEKMARREGALMVEGERRLLSLALDDIEAQAIAAKPEELPPESYASYAPKEKNKRGFKEFFVELRTMQSIVRFIDGIDNGPLAKNTIQKLNRAGAEGVARLRLEEERVVALFRAAYGINVEALRKDQINIPGIPVPLAKMERLTVALYWGTEISRRRIMDGYGWDQATVQRVLDTLDQTDWKFLTSVWDYVNSLYPEATKAHEEVHGVPLSKQPGLPIVTKYGVIQGDYFPIRYNPHQSSRADQQAITDTAKQITGRAGTRKATGSTKERVKGKVTMPVLLDFSITLGAHVNEVVGNIATQKAILDAGRIIAHPRTQKVIVSRHGWVTYKALMSAMRDTRNGLAGPRGPTERIMVRVRNGATNVALGLNIGTVIKQMLGYTTSIVRLGDQRTGPIAGAGWLLRGMVRMGFSASGMQNGTAFILERSPYMRVRMQVMNQAIADQQRRINDGNIKADAKRAIDVASMFMMQRVQWLAVDGPTWLGAYEKFTASGMSEKDAAAGADQIVIDAQGSGEIFQVSAFQRGGPMQRIFTNYITAAIANWNLAVNTTRQTNFRNPGQAAIWAMNMGVLMVVPVIGSMAVAAMMSPGGGDEDEPLEEQYIREQVAFLIGPLGLFGQLGSAVAGFGYNGPQGTRAFEEASKVITETFTGAERVREGTATTKDAIDILRPANMAAGVWFGYPAAALDRFVRGAEALISGRTEDPKALLSGPPRE
jgi:hypothetical protein